MGSSHSRLTLPAKRLRAEVIAAYVRAAGLRGVVCFTCGNAAEELRRQGLDVVEIGPRGELEASQWWPPGRIARTWPDRLDATSGHLPAHVMAAIADRLRRHLGRLAPGCIYDVATGSGETIICLAWAYPGHRFAAVYDQADAATQYEAEAPLNGLVRALAVAVIGAPPEADVPDT